MKQKHVCSSGMQLHSTLLKSVIYPASCDTTMCDGAVAKSEQCSQ